MKEFKYEIIPYSEDYEASLLELENEATQGKFIQLEMIRNCFNMRSMVFDKSQLFLAVDFEGSLMGILGAAIVLISLNGKEITAGYYYDIRVKKKCQGFGLTTKMAKYAYKNFYIPNDVSFLFTTMKKSNKAAFKSAENLGFEMFEYPFLYLTITTHIRLKKTEIKQSVEELAITCTSASNQLDPYIQHVSSKFKVWQTNLIYKLKLIKIHPVLNFINQLRHILNKSMKNLPKVGDELSFATLMYRETPTTDEMNEILSILQKQHIDFLLVACKGKSRIFKMLSRYAINRYKYILYSTFPINERDYMGLDVRCL